MRVYLILGLICISFAHMFYILFTYFKRLLYVSIMYLCISCIFPLLCTTCSYAFACGSFLTAIEGLSMYLED